MASDDEKHLDDEVQTFDGILAQIGQFGLFQMTVIFFMVLIAVTTGYQNMCPVFTLNIPKHRCSINSLGNDSYLVQNSNHQRLISQYIPLDDGGEYSPCSIYKPCEGRNHSTCQKEPCSSWVYDTAIFERTLTTDLDLVCKKKMFRSHSTMLIFAGKFLGALLQGFASDRFGRRRVVMVTAVGVMASSIGNAFVTSVTMLFVFRFLTGMMTTSCYLAIFVLTIEYMRPNERTKVALVAKLAFVFGQLTMALISYTQRDWQVLQKIVIWPSVLLVVCLWMVPESSRWLLARNKKTEAIHVLQKVAKMNKVDLPPGTLAILTSGQGNRPTSSPLALFSDPRLALRWSVLYLNWVVMAMVYYGLTLNVSNMGGDIFVNFSTSVSVELLASLITGCVIDKVSRKYFTMTSMIISGCACAATFIPVLLQADQWVVIALSMVGKMGVSAGFFVIYVYTSELFPTQCRAFGLGSSSMMARVGGIASPYVADLNTYVHGQFGEILPQLVFGFSGIVAGLLIFILPETRGTKLPETIDDIKHRSRRKHSEDFITKPRGHKMEPVPSEESVFN